MQAAAILVLLLAGEVSEVDLPELLELGLKQSQLLSISKAQLAQAEALSKAAKSHSYPTGSLTALFGGPTPEAKTRNVNDLASVTRPSLTGDYRFGQLGVTARVEGQIIQPIYGFGKLSALEEASSHVIDAAKAQEAASQADLALKLYQAFWAYQLAREAEASLLEGDARLEKVLAQVEDLLENESPQVVESDRLRLSYARSQLQALKAKAENGKALALEAIKMLTQWPETRPLHLAERELSALPDALPTLETLLSKLTMRPELKALSALQKAAQAFVRFRKRSLAPSFFLGGMLSYAYTSNATDQTNPFLYDPYNDFSAGIGLGLRVDLDVFQKLAEVSRAEAEAELRGAQASLATAAATLDLKRQLLDLKSHYAAIQAYKKATKTGRAWLLSTVMAYDVGAGSAKELTDAFLAWATAKGDLEKTQFEAQMAWAGLAKASGELVERLQAGSSAAPKQSAD